MNVKTIKLTNRIYAIDSPFGSAYVRTYVILGERAAILDTGVRSTGPVLIDLLDDLGSPEVAAAIHSHGHYDHIGGAAAVCEAIRCPIASHTLDAAMIESHEANDARFLRMFPEYDPRDVEINIVRSNIGAEAKVDICLTGGEEFDLGAGVVLDIIPMPGHTPGCIGVFDRSSGTLFSADSLAGPGPFNTLAQYEDVSAYRETILKMRDLPIEHLLTGHFEPIADAEIGKFLDVCLEEIDKIDKSVRLAAKSHSDLVSIAKCVCQEMNKPFMLQALMTASAHLGAEGRAAES